MLFCPHCANLLLVEQSHDHQLYFTCRTCGFRFLVDRKLTVAMRLERKEVDDVLGGEEAWKNVDKTEGEFLLLLFLSSVV
jgi:DNA-directed RNA polymerase III subunit RPC11